ncbi:MAG: hypothetical protein LBS34_00175 [Rickettsiales bacterium]|nr:hypothetical protein [Rickettsiales bacterium]
MGYTTFKNGLGIFEIDNYSEMVIAVQPLTTQFFSEQAVHGERDTELDRVFNYTAKKMRVVSLSGNH